MRERKVSFEIAERREMQALDNHKKTINYQQKAMAKIATEVGEDPYLPDMIKSLSKRSLEHTVSQESLPKNNKVPSIPTDSTINTR